MMKTAGAVALAAALAALPGCQGDDGQMTAVLSSTIQSELLRHGQGLAIRPSMHVVLAGAESLDEDLAAEYIRDRLKGVPRELVEDLVTAVGRRSGAIERLDEIRGPYVLLSEEQEERLARDWRSLSPELSGILGADWIDPALCCPARDHGRSSAGLLRDQRDPAVRLAGSDRVPSEERLGMAGRGDAQPLVQELVDRALS